MVENINLMEGGSEKIMNVFRGGAIPIYDEDNIDVEKIKKINRKLF